MQAALLATKLHIPKSRPQIVSRPRLVDKLNDGFHHKLTLISAPAGFGKTTLLSEWIAGIEQPVGWLQLDEGDNDTTRFLKYLIAACQTGAPSVGEAILSELLSPQPLPAEAILTHLVNDIATLSDDLILILDDYHLIDAEPVNDVLAFLLDHLPAQMHLVIITREDPHLPLARLRGMGQLTELRAVDLRFTTDEAAEFLNRVMALDLSTVDINALENRTEGWITGLQLAAISMQGSSDAASFIRSFTGSHRYVLEYLIEEVLEQQSGDIQDFLLKTAILDRMTGSLCDAVADQTDSQATLAMLERANLFVIPLDHDKCWYRYHHLFASLLRSRLNIEHPNLIPTLYTRAADWYLEQDDTVKAIECFLLAGAHQEAANIIRLGRSAVFSRELSALGTNHSRVIQWLDTLPSDMVKKDPMLSIMAADSLWFLGKRNAETIVPRYDDAERAYNRLVANGDLTPDSPDYVSIPFAIFTGRSKLMTTLGNYELADHLARKALDLEHPDDPVLVVHAYIALHLANREMGNHSVTVESSRQIMNVSLPANYHYGFMEGMLGVGFSYQLMGRLTESVDMYRQILAYAESNNLMWARQVVIVYIKWGEILCLQNDLAQAETYLTQAIELSEQYEYRVSEDYARLYLAQLKLIQGDNQAALGLLQDVDRVIYSSQLSAFMHEDGAISAWVQAKTGDVDLALAWADSLDIQVGERIGFWQSVELIHAARILVTAGQHHRASNLLEALIPAAQNSASLVTQIEALVLLAVIRDKQADNDAALTVLKEAIKLAAPECVERPFLNEGALMESLLSQVDSHEDPVVTFTEELLRSFSVPDKKAYRPDPVDWIDPLSDREIEVLALISEGLTNSEIATRLFLSPHTIKVHTRNIYSKLDAHNRTEAVLKARITGVLADFS